MKAVVTVSNNSIHSVLRDIRLWAMGRAKKTPKVHLVGFGEKLPDQADVILLPSASMLYAARKELAKRPVVVVVFDAPLQCTQISPALHLDIEHQRPSYRMTFRKLTLGIVKEVMEEAWTTKETKVEWERIEVAPRLMGQQLTSILQPIQTFLYSVKGPDNRLHFQKLIFTWMVSEAPRKVLEDKIMEEGKFRKMPSALSKLLDSLDKHEGARAAFREALARKAEKKPVSYKKLSAKYSVATFDLRYTMSQMRKIGRFSVVQKTVHELYAARQKKPGTTA